MARTKKKPKAVVWDLDGTLSDDRARAHFVEVERGRARDWHSYFDAIDQDPPIAASMEVLSALRAAGIRIVFLTGRPEYTREKTERWLEANGLTDYDRLLMRPRGDFRPSGHMKVDEIARLRREYELVCAFEDRIDVADDLREAGLPVFLFGAGMEAAAEALEVLDAEQDELVERKEAREAREAGREKPSPRRAAKRSAAPKSSADEGSAGAKKATRGEKKPAGAKSKPAGKKAGDEKPAAKKKEPAKKSGARASAGLGTKRKKDR